MFAPFTKAVCINGGPWSYERLSRNTYFYGLIKGSWKKDYTGGPAKNEIVEIVSVTARGHLALLGYERFGFYDPAAFRPLITDELSVSLDEMEKAPKEEPEPALV